MEIITTSSRGQIVIPESMRKKHDIKKGTRLVLFDDGDKIIIEREEKITAILKMKSLNENSGWQTGEVNGTRYLITGSPYTCDGSPDSPDNQLGKRVLEDFKTENLSSL